jgi:sugar/nucleoside kinase (ribokinase family)
MRLPFEIPSATSRAFDLVGLGQNSLDYVAVLNQFPQPNQKQGLRDFSLQPGGQIATALVASARLGWRTRYVGCFGDDEAGRVSRDSLSREGVDLSAGLTVPGAKNRVAMILVDAQVGERTILAFRDPALRLDQVPHAAVVSGRLLLVDCEERQAATTAVAAARASGIPTIVDVDDVQPGIEALLRQIDAIIVAEEFPCRLTGRADVGQALEAIEREFHAGLVCVTLGAKGSLARSYGREIRTAPYVVDVVDTTGAGDVFRGAFASACLRWPDGDVDRLLAYANAAAALSCRALGARGGLPSQREIDRILGL